MRSYRKTDEKEGCEEKTEKTDMGTPCVIASIVPPMPPWVTNQAMA